MFLDWTSVACDVLRLNFVLRLVVEFMFLSRRSLNSLSKVYETGNILLLIDYFIFYFYF